MKFRMVTLHQGLLSLCWERSWRGFFSWKGLFPVSVPGIVDAAALGILVDDSPRGYQSDCGRLRADAAAVRRVAHCLEHGCCRRYPPVCADSDRSSHALPQIMLALKVGQFRGPTRPAASDCLPPARNMPCLKQPLKSLPCSKVTGKGSVSLKS